MLSDMLCALDPRLRQGEFAFCTVPVSRQADYVGLAPLASFREDEGMTLVLDTGSADNAGLVYGSVFRCITLGVNSSLDSVGLTAAVSSCLARHRQGNWQHLSHPSCSLSISVLLHSVSSGILDMCDFLHNCRISLLR